MDRARQYGRTTFSSLAIPNYRRYVIGQGISLCGTWMQTVAQGLLVLRLTGNGTDLGLVIALQTLPILLFGPWGGVIADRYPKRSILFGTQIASACLALSLGCLVAFDLIQLWLVYLLALGLGSVNAIDNPTRQTFVVEMVGRDQLANAVSLNSTEINLARVIGPSIAGALVSTVGLATCFLLNGLSFLAVIVSLWRMVPAELLPSPGVARARGQLGEGLRFVRSSPPLFSTLIMMAIIGTLTYEFTVSLPLFAAFTFHDGSSGYAAMTAMMGLGAVIGGLVTAGRRLSGTGVVQTAAFLFGISVLLAALAPRFWIALVGLVVVGFFSITLTSIGNVTVQMHSTPELRGRIMALWTIAFLGSTPIGGPIIGWIGESAGPRWSLLVGGFAAVSAAVLGRGLLRRAESHPETATAVTQDRIADLRG